MKRDHPAATAPAATPATPATPLPPATAEASSAAKAAGLRYVHDHQPGIARRKRGKHFHYVDADGDPVKHADTLARIKSLVIPPAWTDVWICPRATGHIQATGRDVKGRKQYRYHDGWSRHASESKFERLPAFARALPRLRKRVEADLNRRGVSRDKVLATAAIAPTWMNTERKFLARTRPP